MLAESVAAWLSALLVRATMLPKVTLGEARDRETGHGPTERDQARLCRDVVRGTTWGFRARDRLVRDGQEVRQQHVLRVLVGHRDGQVLRASVSSDPFNSANADVFWVGLYCGPVHVPFPPEPCVADHATPFHVRGMEVRLSEDKLPTVHRPVGTLLARGPQSGVRTLSYTASDLHSGLARVDVLLGDTVVKSRDLTPRCSYSDFTACPTSDDETLEVDTRLVPNGSYDLVLRVRDAAGNEQLVHGERAIEVANESASVSRVPFRTRSSRTSKARRARRSRCPMVDE